MSKSVYSVQMTFENYDIKEHYQQEFPILYKEVFAHDRITDSSWYDLSQKAYEEYKLYISNGIPAR